MRGLADAVALASLANEMPAGKSTVKRAREGRGVVPAMPKGAEAMPLGAQTSRPGRMPMAAASVRGAKDAAIRLTDKTALPALAAQVDGQRAVRGAGGG